MGNEVSQKRMDKFIETKSKISEKNKTLKLSNDLHLVIILDESSSMSGIKNDIISSINTMMKDQKELKDDNTTVSLIKFSDIISINYENHPLRNIKYITNKDYQPNGSTALYDAIGYAINKYKNNDNVCMFIVTDGEENSSRRYTHETVTSLIDRKKEDGWKFIYLSSDLSTVKQGRGMGFYSNSYDVLDAKTQNVVADFMKLGSNIRNECNMAIGDLRRKGYMRGMGAGSLSSLR